MHFTFVNHSDVLTVYQAEFVLFHQRHFPNAPLPAELQRAIAEENRPEDEVEDEGEDDGLGYYPDGTKRSLTDEQIAIFRHSEIQELIKQRDRLQDSANLRQSEVNEPDGVTNTPLITLEDLEKDREINMSNADSKRNNLTKNERSKKRRFRKREKNLRKSQGGALVNMKTNEERYDPFDYISDGEQRTHRRKAREADEVQTEAIELDY